MLAGCENALAKDPTNLDAHWLLAGALAQTGDDAAAVEHVALALAGDYFYYSQNLTTDDLKELMASPHGKSIAELATRIGAEYDKRIANGLYVVARRGAWHWPEHHDVQPDTPRGEVYYAYDRELKRYLRVTHTEHQVAGFQRAPSGGEIALIGFDRVDYPASKDDPPLVQRAWVQVVGARDGKPLGGRATLPPAAREVSLGYTPEEQLLVSTAPATGRSDVTERRDRARSLDKHVRQADQVDGGRGGRRRADRGHARRRARRPGPGQRGTRRGRAIRRRPRARGRRRARSPIPGTGKVSAASVAVAPDRGRAWRSRPRSIRARRTSGRRCTSATPSTRRTTC